VTGATRDAGRSVIVFDDDVRFIRLVERILACEDMRVEPITTLDVDDGLKIVQAHDPLAVLVDIFMYDAARGYDFIERLRGDAVTRSIPIIVTSGADRELRRSSAWFEELGCDVLLKPFPADALVELVLRASHRRQPALISGNGCPRRPTEPDDLPHTFMRWLDRARHARDGAHRTAAP